jgi:hypothetical protein
MLSLRSILREADTQLAWRSVIVRAGSFETKVSQDDDSGAFDDFVRPGLSGLVCQIWTVTRP